MNGAIGKLAHPSDMVTMNIGPHVFQNTQFIRLPLEKNVVFVFQSDASRCEPKIFQFPRHARIQKMNLYPPYEVWLWSA